MATRCGSYPIMNLAEDYGVDYGDLLLWADFYENGIWSRDPYPQGRVILAYAAVRRMALAFPESFALNRALSAIIRARGPRR